jgi:hypothetical protein
MQVWLNIESYVFFNLLSKFEEKSHNIADPYNFSYFFLILRVFGRPMGYHDNH